MATLYKRQAKEPQLKKRERMTNHLSFVAHDELAEEINFFLKSYQCSKSDLFRNALEHSLRSQTFVKAMNELYGVKVVLKKQGG